MMVAPKAVLRKTHILNKFTAQETNNNNDDNRSHNENLDIKNKELFDYQNQTNDDTSTFSSASSSSSNSNSSSSSTTTTTTANFTSPLILNKHKNNNHNGDDMNGLVAFDDDDNNKDEIGDDIVLEAHNKSFLDFLPKSGEKNYNISQSIKRLLIKSSDANNDENDNDNNNDDDHDDGDDDDHDGFDMMDMARSNLTTEEHIDGLLAADDVVDGRGNNITGSDRKSAIFNTLLGSVMTTATAPITATAAAATATSTAATTTILPSTMAQLATTTYFHLINQQYEQQLQLQQLQLEEQEQQQLEHHHTPHYIPHHNQYHHHQIHNSNVNSNIIYNHNIDNIANNININMNNNNADYNADAATQLIFGSSMMATAATESPLSYLLTSSSTSAAAAATTTAASVATATATATATSVLVSVNDTAAAATTTAASLFWATDTSDFDFLYRHSLQMTIVYCVAYIFVFLVGLIGNSFVIAVVLRAPRMRTVTNYFIVNLAIADILVIVFCLPATLMSNIFVPWILGWLMCKTVPYIQGVSVAASVYSLIAVSLDRFIAIWWPLKQMTKSRARFMILCIWIIALSSTIPWVLFFDLVPAADAFPAAPDMYLCQEVWPPGTNGNLYFLLAHLVACYLLPMSLITLCYVLIWIKVSTRTIPGDSKDAQMDRMQQKSKVKVIKMLVAVVILFVLSWLPLYVIFARIKFGGEISIEESAILNKVTPFAQWLGASNSCINPILYAFFNKKYRRGFAAIIQSRSCCGRLRYYDNVAIASSTTSTRKSSHYHHNNSRKSPSSPGLRKTNAVSYIYEHNSLRRHNLMMKQDSNLSQQMLLKQDSHGSRQYLIKQESASSDGSRRLLCQQDSNGSKISLSKQDSVVSYIESKRNTQINNQERLQDTFTTQDSISIDSRRGTIYKQDSNQHGSLIGSPTSSTLLEYKRQKFVKQDSVISFADQRPEPRRHQLVKQDSVISFADQRKGVLGKQDSIIACPNRSGDGIGHHVSILKKTDSQLSNGFSSPRRNIEIYE